MQESMRTSNTTNTFQEEISSYSSVKLVREEEVENGLASSRNYSLRQRSVNHVNEKNQCSERECDVGNTESVVGENLIA